MKVEIISKETIKPSSPTPIHLKTYTMSVMDQLAISSYTSLVLVYRPKNNNEACIEGSYDQFSQTLKNSLSDTLTLFPPLAGKIIDNVSVDCNDDGVQCFETRVHSTLDQLLSHRDIMTCLRRLIAVDDGVNVHTDSQLFVQINSFSCGGIALGVSFSHKLCDAATFAAFLKSWSARAINSGHVIVPDLTVSTSLPPRKDVLITRPIVVPPPMHEDKGLTFTRLVFDGPKIAALKAKSASETTPHPTRVEAVTALIGKCATTASKTNNKTQSMAPYVFTHIINIRKVLVPPLPENAFGNVVGVYSSTCSEEQGADTGLDVLVSELRKARTEFSTAVPMCVDLIINWCVEKFGNVPQPVVFQEDLDVAGLNSFTSWCRFGFYEADFGMGSPVWVGVPPVVFYKNFISLMDTKDGDGVEAYVVLEKRDMALFQSDPLLMQFRSVAMVAEL